VRSSADPLVRTRVTFEEQAVDVQQAYAMLVERLARAGVASPRAESWQLIEAATGGSRGGLLMAPRTLSREERRRLGEWLARRELREPLQRILGRAHFYGLELRVSGGVLIPRPETERLVELTLVHLRGVPSPFVIDIGTGSGAVALAVKNERPDARVVATDCSAEALSVAAGNADDLGLQVELVQADLLEGEEMPRLVRGADVVVSNPPYLPSEDRRHAQPEVRWDPEEALYAGVDGLAVFRRLQAQASALCRSGTLLLLELDPRNVDTAAAEAASEAAGWRSTRIEEDLTGRRRFLILRR
jgi:release factor glutamine methyltransferase